MALEDSCGWFMKNIKCHAYHFSLVELLFNKTKEKPHKNVFIYLMEKKVEHLLLDKKAH